MNAAVSTRGVVTTVVEVVVATSVVVVTSVVATASDTTADVGVLPGGGSDIATGMLDDDTETAGVGSLGGAGSPTGSVTACEHAARTTAAAHDTTRRSGAAAIGARYDADR